MASLLRKYPSLALHLTDHTRAPILSSASALDEKNTSYYSGKNEDKHPDQAIRQTPTHSQRAQALDHLADTALRARDTAARLSMGNAQTDSQGLWADSSMTPPECIMVSYNTGVVMVESFLNPRQPRKYNPRGSPVHSPRHNPGQGLRKVTSGPTTRPASGPEMANCRTGPTNRANAVTGGNTDEEGVGSTPLIMGLVVAPGPQALAEAQRASAQLERMGRAVQQELIAEGRNRD